MRFKFSTLENIQTAELTEVFNSAFADYFVKIKLNEELFEQKIITENLDLSKSVGGFLDDKLVGFILIGIEDKKSYNGGTGVISNARGNHLTEKMSEFILPKLKNEGIEFQQLEVITENAPAIKIYEKIGFKRVRTLACFKGKIAISKINQEIELKVLDEIDLRLFPTFWNSQPSWQNSLSAIQRTKDLHKIVGAFYKENLVGYIVYSETGRIKQFAVKKDFRHLGIGQTLFSFANSELGGKEIIITNIEKDDFETISFLDKLGLNLFLAQFEMMIEWT